MSARIGMGLVLAIATAGCNPAKDDEASGSKSTESLPAELQAIQGSWVTQTTNILAECFIVVDGDTIRIKSRKAMEEPLIRRNLVIADVDEELNRLVMHNDAGAWIYNLRLEGGEEHLDLEFISDITHNWVRISMRRRL